VTPMTRPLPYSSLPLTNLPMNISISILCSY
jgi:hypothetical protein